MQSIFVDVSLFCSQHTFTHTHTPKHTGFSHIQFAITCLTALKHCDGMSVHQCVLQLFNHSASQAANQPTDIRTILIRFIFTLAGESEITHATHSYICLESVPRIYSVYIPYTFTSQSMLMLTFILFDLISLYFWLCVRACVVFSYCYYRCALCCIDISIWIK